MQQRYRNLNGPVSIVILAAEFSHCGTNGGRDKIFWCCLTPQSPWLQHLWLANGLSDWRQGGVGLRDAENNGLSAWVSTISLLRSPCYSALFSLQQTWPANGSFVLWRENTHTYWHTHTRRKKEVSGGWEDCGAEKKSIAGTIVCADVKWPNLSLYAWTTTDFCSNLKRDVWYWSVLLFFFPPSETRKNELLKRCWGDTSVFCSAICLWVLQFLVL